MGLAAALALHGVSAAAQEPGDVLGESVPTIQDNSFLLEEAYNQDAGVVQHISNFARAAGGRLWAYTFTQEWPLSGMRHQGSYTIPFLHDGRLGDGATGVGDIFLHYRYQLVGRSTRDRLLVAPRLSLILPTGDELRGRGAGGVGIQTNTALTAVVRPWLATHWNAGATLVPRARVGPGPSATTLSFHLGASGIWLLSPRLNLLVETLWTSIEQPLPGGGKTRAHAAVVSPGVRGAFNFASGLQIVPGVAYTVGVDGDVDDALLLYLSFEHPIGR